MGAYNLGRPQRHSRIRRHHFLILYHWGLLLNLGPPKVKPIQHISNTAHALSPGTYWGERYLSSLGL